MPPITLKEIARRSHVSSQAVSAVLNNRQGSRVSSETRERILRVARESGYRPHFGYQLMRGQTPPTIALLVSINYIRITEYTRDLLLTLMDRFNDGGYATYVHTFGRDAAENLDKARELINRGVSHFVFLGSPFGHGDILREIEASKLHHLSTSPNFPRHITEGHAGRLQLLRHFRERFGDAFRVMCQDWEAEDGTYLMDNLAEVFPERPPGDIRARLIHAIPRIDYENAPPGPLEKMLFSLGRDEAGPMRARYPDARAFVFMNDYFALGAAAALRRDGVVPGRDLSLAGHDNVLALQLSEDPISTVAFDLPRLADLLLERTFDDGDCRLNIPSTAILRP